MAPPCNFDELSGSCRSRHSIDSGNADERHFLIPWGSRFAFAQYLTGYEHPSLPGAYPADIEIRPLSDDVVSNYQLTDPLTQLPVYAQNNGKVGVVICHYATDFSTAPWPCDVEKPSIEAGTQLRFEARISSQVLYMRPEDMRHEDNPDGSVMGAKWGHDSQAGRKLIDIVEWSLAWLYVQEPPIETWRTTLKGRVNDDTFLGAPAECLLFEGFDVRPSTRFSLTDPFCFELGVQFRERRIKVGSETYGWNHEYGWGDDGFKWYRVKMDDGAGGTVDRYEKTDFSGMFSYSECSSSSGE